jgi:hypothetical protein
VTTAFVAPTTKLLHTRPLPEKLHRNIWAKCGWNPHPLQREILLSRKRQRVLAAGRRAGKSQIGGYALVAEAFRALGELPTLEERNLRREYWIVGPEYSDAEKEFRVVWDSLKRLGFDFDKPGSYNNPDSGEMHISMFDRRFIVSAKSAKYPGTLVGEGLSGVVFSEAAKLKEKIFNKYIRPTLADFGGWSLFGSTPEGRNWFYDFWNIGMDANRLDWGGWRAPSWANPFVYPGGCDEALLETFRVAQRESAHAFDTAMNSVHQIQTDMGFVPVGIDPEIWSLFLDMSPEMFAQEVCSTFTEYVGRVFKAFDEETHVNDIGLRQGWRTYACVDYGFTNPFAWLLLQVDPFNERVHVVAEYYETQRTTGEAAAEIRARGLAPNSGDYRVLEFFPDPAEPDRTREISGLLGLRAGSGTATPINDRLEWIRRLLKTGPAHLDPGHPERLPYLTFNRRCINAIREMGAMRYPETAEQAMIRDRPAPEHPLKKDDHCPEALGRFMSGHFGNPWQVHGAARQSTARVGRRRR